LGYVVENTLQMYRDAMEFTLWRDQGVNIREGGEGKFLGTATKGEVVAFVDAVNGETYIVARDDGRYDVFLISSDPASSENPLDDFPTLDMGTIPRSLARPKTTREQMRDIARRTIEQYG